MSYKKRYQETKKQAAYENACDCLYYGYGRKYWNSCGLEESEADKVWNQAFKDIVEDF